MRCQVASGSGVTRAGAVAARRDGAGEEWDGEGERNAPGGREYTSARAAAEPLRGPRRRALRKTREKPPRQRSTQGRGFVDGSLLTALWTGCPQRPLVYSPDPLPGRPFSAMKRTYQPKKR